MWILLLALVVGAHADQECDACINDRCHTRRTLLQGLRITDQLAIDRTNNILYTQLNGDTTIAFFLDKPRILTVQVANTTGLAVDQETQTLYSSRNNGIIYAHKLKEDGYYTEATFRQDGSKTPARLRYEDTLYTINKDGTCGYFYKGWYQFAGYDNLKDYAVTDMVNVKAITNWFYVSDNKLYRYILSGGESWRLISDKKHVLSIGKNGDNYFGDASQKVIYKLDRQSMDLKEYASYESSAVEDFVFDRDENIVFLDADGNVAQWVPGSTYCTQPRHFRTHYFTDWEQRDNSIMWVLRGNDNELADRSMDPIKPKILDITESEDSELTSSKVSTETEDPDTMQRKADAEMEDSDSMSREEYIDGNNSDPMASNVAAEIGYFYHTPTPLPNVEAGMDNVDTMLPNTPRYPDIIVQSDLMPMNADVDTEDSKSIQPNIDAEISEVFTGMEDAHDWWDDEV